MKKTPKTDVLDTKNRPTKLQPRKTRAAPPSAVQNAPVAAKDDIDVKMNSQEHARDTLAKIRKMFEDGTQIN